MVLKAVGNDDGARAFFKYYEKYKNESWIRDVTLKAVLNEDGAEAFLQNYKKLDFNDKFFKFKLFLLATKYHKFKDKLQELGFTKEEFLDNPIIAQERLEECLGRF